MLNELEEIIECGGSPHPIEIERMESPVASWILLQIKAPLYFWNEFELTGIDIQGCPESAGSLLKKESLTLDDFSYPDSRTRQWLLEQIRNFKMDRYLYDHTDDLEEKREIERRVIARLPNCYKVKRSVFLSHAIIRNICQAGKNSRQIEWKLFCKALEDLIRKECEQY